MRHLAFTAALLVAIPTAANAQSATVDPTQPTVVILPQVTIAVVEPRAQSMPAYDPETPPVARDEAPVVTRAPRRQRRGMLITGIATLSATYALTAATGFLATMICSSSPDVGCDPAPYMWLFVPVIGPFAALAYGHPDGSAVALGVIDGLLQAGSVALMVGDLARRERPESMTAPSYASRAPAWNVMPFASNTTAGLALSVRTF
jgi:hypothetical protein